MTPGLSRLLSKADNTTAYESLKYGPRTHSVFQGICMALQQYF